MTGCKAVRVGPSFLRAVCCGPVRASVPMPSKRSEIDWDDAPAPARRRPWRWVGLCFLLLVVGLAGFYLAWSKHAERRIARMIEEIRAAGEPVEPQDLVHPPVPLENDAAVDLLAAAAALDENGAAFKAVVEIDYELPLSRKQARAIADLLAAERDVLEHVRAARGKTDADWKIPYQSPMISILLPHLNGQRSLAHVSRAAAVDARLNGDDAAALEHLRDVLTVARASDTQQFMVGHLVSVGITAIATHQLGLMAPDLHVAGGAGAGERAATPEHVRTVIRELLDEGPAEAGIRSALRGERVMLLDTMKLLAERKLDVNAVMGGTPGGPKGFPPIPRGLILADAGIIIGQNTGVLNAHERSPDYATYLKNAPPMPAAVGGGSKLHFIAGMLIPAHNRFVQQHYRSKADRRLTAAALALRLYAADHGGRYPATLDELVPKYLPAVPVDPFAAGSKPLCYLTEDPAAPVLYSVGENGADDGGTAAPANARRARPGRWDGIDGVLQMTPRPLLMTEEEDRAEAEQQ